MAFGLEGDDSTGTSASPQSVLRDGDWNGVGI